MVDWGAFRRASAYLSSLESLWIALGVLQLLSSHQCPLWSVSVGCWTPCAGINETIGRYAPKGGLTPFQIDWLRVGKEAILADFGWTRSSEAFGLRSISWVVVSD